jgi:hypothetical protein
VTSPSEGDLTTRQLRERFDSGSKWGRKNRFQRGRNDAERLVAIFLAMSSFVSFAACMPLKPYSWVGSFNFVNAAGLRPQDSVFVGLSNFPSFDWNHAGKERTKMSFGFF